MLETQRTGKLSQIVCLQDIYCFSWLLKFQETTCPEKLVEKERKKEIQDLSLAKDSTIPRDWNMEEISGIQNSLSWRWHQDLTATWFPGVFINELVLKERFLIYQAPNRIELKNYKLCRLLKIKSSFKHCWYFEWLLKKRGICWHAICDNSPTNGCNNKILPLIGLVFKGWMWHENILVIEIEAAWNWLFLTREMWFGCE